MTKKKTYLGSFVSWIFFQTYSIRFTVYSTTFFEHFSITGGHSEDEPVDAYMSTLQALAVYTGFSGQGLHPFSSNTSTSFNFLQQQPGLLYTRQGFISKSMLSQSHRARAAGINVWSVDEAELWVSLPLRSVRRVTLTWAGVEGCG